MVDVRQQAVTLIAKHEPSKTENEGSTANQILCVLRVLCGKSFARISSNPVR